MSLFPIKKKTTLKHNLSIRIKPFLIRDTGATNYLNCAEAAL